jgi:hypothetical protein
MKLQWQVILTTFLTVSSRASLLQLNIQSNYFRSAFSTFFGAVRFTASFEQFANS